MRKICIVTFVVLLEVSLLYTQALEATDETQLYVFHEEAPIKNRKSVTLDLNDESLGSEVFELSETSSTMDSPEIKMQKSKTALTEADATMQYEYNPQSPNRALNEAHPYQMVRKRKKIHFPFFNRKSDEKSPEKRNEKNKLICFNCQKHQDGEAPKITTLGPYDIREQLSFYRNSNGPRSNSDDSEGVQKELDPLVSKIAHINDATHMPVAIHNTRQKIFFDNRNRANAIQSSSLNDFDNTIEGVPGKQLEINLATDNDESLSNSSLSDGGDESFDEHEVKRSEEAYEWNLVGKNKGEENQNKELHFDHRGEQRMKELDAVQRKIDAVHPMKPFVKIEEFPTMFLPVGKI